MEKKRAGVWQYRWKDEVITAGLLLAFGFMINAGIEIRGLFMDDLYLWSCYGEQTFREICVSFGQHPVPVPLLSGGLRGVGGFWEAM